MSTISTSLQTIRENLNPDDRQAIIDKINTSKEYVSMVLRGRVGRGKKRQAIIEMAAKKAEKNIKLRESIEQKFSK